MTKHLVLLSVGIGLACLLILGMGSSDDRPAGTKDERGKLEGTWEHTFEDAPQHRQVKIINQTHFVWVTYDRQTGLPLVLGGGTYTYDGKTYKEKYEFGSRGLPQELVGKEQVFSVTLDGDKWTHAGTLTNGFRVLELWRKVK